MICYSFNDQVKPFMHVFPFVIFFLGSQQIILKAGIFVAPISVKPRFQSTTNKQKRFQLEQEKVNYHKVGKI